MGGALAKEAEWIVREKEKKVEKNPALLFPKTLIPLALWTLPHGCELSLTALMVAGSESTNGSLE